jgi:hypothetical protein
LGVCQKCLFFSFIGHGCPFNEHGHSFNRHCCSFNMHGRWFSRQGYLIQLCSFPVFCSIAGRRGIWNPEQGCILWTEYSTLFRFAGHTL